MRKMIFYMMVGFLHTHTLQQTCCIGRINYERKLYSVNSGGGVRHSNRAQDRVPLPRPEGDVAHMVTHWGHKESTGRSWSARLVAKASPVGGLPTVPTYRNCL